MAAQHAIENRFNRILSRTHDYKRQGINVSDPRLNAKIRNSEPMAARPCAPPTKCMRYVPLQYTASSSGFPPHFCPTTSVTYIFDTMPANSLVSLAAAVTEALARPESLSASSPEEQKARLDLIDLLPELNAALVGDVEHLRELAWSVSRASTAQLRQF